MPNVVKPDYHEVTARAEDVVLPDGGAYLVR
jgi:hypothetical protein